LSWREEIDSTRGEREGMNEQVQAVTAVLNNKSRWIGGCYGLF